MHRPIAALACTTISLLGATNASAQADTTGRGWVTRALKVDVRPDFQARSLRAAGTISLVLTGEPSSGLSLVLGHDLTPYFRTPTEFMRFVSVTARGARVSLNRPGDKPGLRFADLRFAAPRRPGARLDIAFEVELVRSSFEFVVTDSVSMGAGGTGWYPRVTAPSGVLQAPDIDATPGETRIHMPTGWTSIATGAFAGRSRSRGEVVERWRQDTHNARAFAVGPYHAAERTIGSLSVRVLSLTPAMNPDTLVRSLALIVGALERAFGPYPYSKYAAVEFPDSAVRWWGNALGDFQILRTSLVTASNGGFAPLAHEIGHAWWGNLVEPAGPGGRMINEAMAGYSTLLALEGAFGGARYRHALAVMEPGTPPDFTTANHFRMIAQGQDVALSRLQDGPNDYQISLVKGTFFYHMLRREVGDSTFFGTLRRLLADRAHGTLTLDQMREAFLRASPARGLDTFFAQWLDRTGAPVFEATVSCEAAPGGRVRNRVALTQTQAGEPYRFAMNVRLNGTTPRSEIVQITDRRAGLDIEADECYQRVDLDPDHDLFIWRPEYAAPSGS